jgi:DNA polymerase-3 subunit beta
VKISANRPSLLAELQLVGRAASTRTSIAALGGILIETGDGSAALAATDAELALRSSTEVEVERPGKVLLPARLLMEIVRALEGQKVTLDHRPDKGHVAVSSERAEFHIRTLPADDFPRLPEAGDGAMELAGDVFSQTIERVAKAASRDETRPVLTGILVSTEEGRLRMVATDSYRLSVKETALDNGVPAEFQANIPARTLQEAGRLVRETGTEQVTVAAQDNQIVFGIGRVLLSSRLIDGQFPNYERLLPDSFEHEIEVSRPELAGVVRRVGLMAQRNSPLRMRFDEGTLTVSAQTPDIGEATESIPVNYQGEQLEIGFNPAFLQDGLESVESDDVLFKLISPVRPGLIEAAGGEESSGRFLYLIMPVRLNV